ncbi:MAG TPA: DUF3500 domain-containing protein [Gemmataceae bacterium]|nr:DUF3500 domain-containing protein [Gemmataceae bacterium]
MKLMRMALALTLLGVLAGVAYVRQAHEPAGSKMASAADKLLTSLTAEQKAKATFAFDDKERFNWHFVPLQDANRKPTRKGLPLQDMTPEQKELARALVAAGTSSDGFAKATTIMSLESILHELEKGRTLVRNPEWYFFTIFGTPSKTGKWGWRVEGHHLSLNFAVDGGKIIAATPAFFGANPATVMDGPRKGTRALPLADDLAKELFKTLDDNQKKTAYQEKAFPEVKGQTRSPDVGAPKGLSAAKLTEKQRGLLLRLLQSYAGRMPSDVAEAEMSEVHKAGLDQISFAYNGGVEQGKPHTYRVQGPTFVIEFLNVQEDSAKNPANHIHSVWRNTKGDFGITQ